MRTNGYLLKLSRIPQLISILLSQVLWKCLGEIATFSPFEPGWVLSSLTNLVMSEVL